MKKTVLFAIMLIGLAFSSCKKEEIISQVSNENVSTLDIGSWNMEDKDGVIIPIENVNGIISIDVLIFSDNGNKINLLVDGIYATENSTIVLFRNHDGYFDQSAFSNPSINRGIITIHYN